MTRSRNFGPPESILSDVQRVTRPRVPPRFPPQHGPGPQQLPLHGQLWACQGALWGTCGGAARVGSPTRHPAARSATAPCEQHSPRGAKEKRPLLYPVQVTRNYPWLVGRRRLPSRQNRVKVLKATKQGAGWVAQRPRSDSGSATVARHRTLERCRGCHGPRFV